MARVNCSSFSQSNGRRCGGPYIIDGGCFITQSNTLFVIDPSDMPAYIESMTKNEVIGNNNNIINGEDFSKSNGEMNNSNNNEQEISCCMLTNAKCGMWSVYAVCEDFSAGICGAEDEDEEDIMQQQLDDAENSRVLSLVILNTSDIHMNMVNPEFINTLPWSSVSSNINNSLSFSLPANVTHKSSVSVYSGQIGIFCQESIKLPCNITNDRNSNNDYYSLNEKIQSWLNIWFNRLIQLTCTGNQVGIMDIAEAPVGVVSASGLGDQGEYDVQIIKDDISNEIYACRIVFMKGN